jgi:hypothetical protein
MAEDRTNAPSAEEFKDRLDNLGEHENRGAGDAEPDPATAENPPKDRDSGDEKRVQT